MSETKKENLKFIHLHVHSAFSLLEGAIKLKDLITLCKENNMPAVGVTDTNNVFGAAEFSKKAKGAGIQPIIGIQLSVDFTDIYLKIPKWKGAEKKKQLPDYVPLQNGYASCVLLVKDEVGYNNFSKLISKAYIENSKIEPLGNPVIKFDDLEKFNEGLILLTGGSGGVLNLLLLEGAKEEALHAVKKLKDVFGDRLYIEIQRHGLDAEEQTEPGLLDIAYKENIPLVATNEPYFKTRDIYEAHEALLCISDGRYLSETKRRHSNPEFYFKSQEEMAELFKDLPEALENTINIAKRCSFAVAKRPPLFPKYDEIPEGVTEAEYLRKLAYDGLEKLIKDKTEEEKDKYKARLEHELKIIIDMGFPGYFLVVQDFVKWARKQNIPVAVRGSGAGALTAVATDITDVDPLRFNLFFERFLNPERVSMPDFDVDMCADSRMDVVEYVKNKYGHNKIAQIVTFGTLKARAVIRDVGRVMQMSYGFVDKICKLIPGDPGSKITIKEAVEQEPELKKLKDTDETVEKLIEIGSKLEGLYRHASIHAAGVIIADRPMDELIALYKDASADMPVTQYDMHWVEDQGLIKYDFLGVKTLSVIKKAIDFIKEQHGIDIDIINISLEDPKVFDFLCSLRTLGIFQLESEGMRNVISQVKPSQIEDLMALVALYRPGPLANIPSYAARKHGKEKVEYVHPKLEPILKETYGIIVYQEQVMETAKVLAGYTLGGADLLRRAMGKKKQEEMDKQKLVFIEGCKKNDISEAKAIEIFDLLEKFANYGFNKPHATMYGIIAYRTAYLKCYYPAEFIAASMCYELNDVDKLGELKEDAINAGLKVLPVDINKSDVKFSVENGNIRYAFAALKNVGANVMAEIVKEREENGDFEDIYDFISRVDHKNLNKRMMESLIKAGAFDRLDEDRAKLFHNIEFMLSHASNMAKDKETNQSNLFAGGGAEGTTAENSGFILKTDYKEWSSPEKLTNEKEAIGFYFSAHPLENYKETLDKYNVKTIKEIDKIKDGETIKTAAILEKRKNRLTKNGKKMAILTLSDQTGTYKATAFSEVLARADKYLEDPDNILILTSTVQKDEDRTQLTAQEIRSLDSVINSDIAYIREIEITIKYDDSKEFHLKSLIKNLKNYFNKFKEGHTKIAFIIKLKDKNVKISLNNKILILPTELTEIKKFEYIEDVNYV